MAVVLKKDPSVSKIYHQKVVMMPRCPKWTFVASRSGGMLSAQKGRLGTLTALRPLTIRTLKCMSQAKSPTRQELRTERSWKPLGRCWLLGRRSAERAPKRERHFLGKVPSA